MWVKSGYALGASALVLLALLDVRARPSGGHLAEGSRGRHLRCTMKRWSWHRTRVLLLAIVLGLAMSLSFVQGSVMAAAMVVAADGALDGSSGCYGCGGDDHKDMNAATCLVACGSTAQGVISSDLLPLPSASQVCLQVARLLLSGRFHSPDHGPPKILTLG